MSRPERLEADYATTSLTVGPHPMALVRDRLPKAWLARDLIRGAHGQRVSVAGMVICRQRPGTAKGHCFISLEDETGIANVFVRSELFEARRLVITQESFLEIHGRLQMVDGVTSVFAHAITPFQCETVAAVDSHDWG